VEASSDLVAQPPSVDVVAREESARTWTIAIAIFGPTLLLYLLSAIALYWLVGLF
jgi:hypothetical protein